MVSTASAFDGLPTLKFTGDDVLRMLQAGVLHEDDHVELIEGRLIEMTPQGPAHGARFTHIAALLRDARPSGTHVMSQRPLDVAADSWPEPDIALIRGAILDFADRHPTRRSIAARPPSTPRPAFRSTGWWTWPPAGWRCAAAPTAPSTR